MSVKQVRTLERRFIVSDLIVNERKIEGYAAMFDKRSSDLGGFIERVRPSAFNKTVQEADVRALYNHDANFVLGRNKAGTLELSVDDSGLYYRIDPPDTSYARDLMVSMERGDVNQSSFAFFTIDDEWGVTERDYPLRDLVEVSLVDVSPVTYPAYPDATSQLSHNSAALASLAKRCGAVDMSNPEAVLAALKGEKVEAVRADTSNEEKRNKRIQEIRRIEAAMAEEGL